MTIENGRFTEDTADQILSVLMANAEAELGPDLNDDEVAVIRTFYQPVANLLADLQVDIGDVMDSAQLDFAEGKALDLLVALIGVSRKPSYAATGTATFSRDTNADVDYTIPIGTVIQTDSIDPIRFETTKKGTLSSGTSEVTGVEIEAVESGTQGNLGANTLTVMPDPPTGIESVTNPAQTDGGEDEEDDDNLRERAKSELADGMLATVIGVRNQVLKVQGVKSVSPFINDTNTEDANGLDGHHVEYVVEGGADESVGQTIFESKAAGDGTEGGLRGTGVTIQAEIGNGQTHPVSFTRPTDVLIYVDMDVSVTNEYEGPDEVRDSIIRYLGGLITSGDEEDGTLLAGDDVVYNKILSAIMSVNGVADVTSLSVGKSASPTGTSNLTISSTEVATGDATNGSITITEV